ncbi:cytochrome P450 [Spongiactinospora rosea]|uniref:Cytochrome P450 n=1 Tax=Spongiactinospora rosea TaxID=2248750 RepID=A0A366LMA8_9ACTN|nr:cytochrome P450 [Spongiactinospora rosea]RBQ14569.1 cytochrome P450 [Spongiactinospora rosea]
MPISATARPARPARTLPFHRIVPRLVRDPIAALEAMSAEAAGEIVRLDLGTFRPYLVTHPDHVQQVFRGNAANYTREGVFWRPLHRLFGDGVLSDGPSWHTSRKVLQPVFTARNVDSLIGLMATTVAEAIDELVPASPATIDAADFMAQLVNRTVIAAFFDRRITDEESTRLIPAHDKIALSIVSRLLLPLVPHRVPLPGDRAFHQAVRTFDSVMRPLVARHPAAPPEGDDIFAVLCRARDASGGELDDQWVRDNMVAMFAAGTETTSVALTWLWPVLAENPHVAARLHAEIDEVVGDERVTPDHLPALRYTRMVVQELLRLYPVGWLLPRMVVRDDVMGGVRLQAGANVLISPYLTHRLGEFWEDPLRFDPERFAEAHAGARHRYAYFPFGGGPHQCLGTHVFDIEALLIVAGLLSRFRPRLLEGDRVTPRAAASLRTRRRVWMTLHRRTGR